MIIFFEKSRPRNKILENRCASPPTSAILFVFVLGFRTKFGFVSFLVLSRNVIVERISLFFLALPPHAPVPRKEFDEWQIQG